MERATKDPNLKKNRVPGVNEMSTLRDLAQHNAQMVQALDKRIEEANSTHLALKKRHQELLESTECTESEIVAIKRALVMLKGQKSLIETNQQKLTGLIHPIRRCPTDVLQYMFEWAVEIDESWFWCATNLSHVCRQWRQVALETPNLWTDIHVSSGSKRESVRDFWSRTVKKVKAAPAYVILTVAGTTETHLKVLRECRLDQLPNISSLEFQVHTTEQATFLSSASLHLPTGRVDHLQLTGERSQGLNMDVLAVPRRFPMVESLAIIAIPHVKCSQVGLPAVTTLLISNATNISLQLLGHAFPNIEVVTFKNTTFHASNTGNLVWSNLKELTVKLCPGISWGLLMATNITHLSCWDPIDEGIVAFLASHRTLESLDITYNEDHVYSIATSAPQLRSLTIDSCEEVVEKTRMKLNKLNYLGIYDSEDGSLSLDLFEKIVRSRFFPKKAEESR